MQAAFLQHIVGRSMADTQRNAALHKTAAQRFLRPGQLLVTAVLVALLVISALAVVYSTHRSRELFNEWQQQQRREWALDEDWERLLLEQGTLAAYERVSQRAESKLNMVMPDPAAIRVVKP